MLLPAARMAPAAYLAFSVLAPTVAAFILLRMRSSRGMARGSNNPLIIIAYSHWQKALHFCIVRIKLPATAASKPASMKPAGVRAERARLSYHGISKCIAYHSLAPKLSKAEHLLMYLVTVADKCIFLMACA